ncbi:hypothetical protein KAJ41_00040 [Candidatus Parcubacteria bacterium]|nr:hypothetical protein [Candidatus Parcubacteria bacterium]
MSISLIMDILTRAETLRIVEIGGAIVMLIIITIVIIDTALKIKNEKFSIAKEKFLFPVIISTLIGVLWLLSENQKFRDDINQSIGPIIIFMMICVYLYDFLKHKFKRFKDT